MTQINATTVKCHLVKQSLLKTHRHRKQVKFLRTPINHFARSRHHGKQIKCPRAPIKNFSRYLTVIIMPLCRVRLHCIHLRFFFLFFCLVIIFLGLLEPSITQQAICAFVMNAGKIQSVSMRTRQKSWHFRNSYKVAHQHTSFDVLQ